MNLLRIKPLVLTVVTLLLATVTLAQSSSGNFRIAKNTIDSSSDLSSSANFRLSGTLGQPEASQPIVGSNNFFLIGGFWARANLRELIFEHGFETDLNNPRLFEIDKSGDSEEDDLGGEK